MWRLLASGRDGSYTVSRLMALDVQFKSRDEA